AKGEDGKLRKAVNFEVLRQMLSKDIAEGDEAYEFTWVGKKEAMREAYRSTRKTLRPCPEESVDWDTTQNLYIEGDNLEVLKLLQKSYLGKVKMIYIDPPYNTGNDFIYRDDFRMSQDEYDEESGLFDDDGNRLFKNTDTNGRFHSDWCSMIYSRLLLARNLLTDDGAIYMSIADQEVENLKKIANEVFGEKNFIGQIIWESTTQPDNIGSARFRFQQKAEYLLFYAKNKSSLAPFILEKMENTKKYPHDGKFGKCRFEIIERSYEGAYARPTMRFQILGQYPREGKQWQIGEAQARILEAEGKVEIVDGIVKRAVYPVDELYGENVKPFWSILLAKEVGTSQKGKALLKELLGQCDFETVKPVSLIKKLLRYFIRDGLVLDFFSGSATTAHAVMELNIVHATNTERIQNEYRTNTERIQNGTIFRIQQSNTSWSSCRKFAQKVLKPRRRVLPIFARSARNESVVLGRS
ncbi:MAG: site-specific DNA-methyltransferase, partial [Thermoguttaceae bacterium]|nr:site-specific DNA-methyltransferase [Thermoguttaceae bacterium]